jgi:non-ribosomal peptide synthetase component E (peptide arylation enzyme)
MTNAQIKSRYTAEQVAAFHEAGLWGEEVLWDYLERAVAKRPDVLCVADGREEVTFSEMRDRSLRVAEGLCGLGVGRGDRVVVQLPNWVEAVVAYYAIARLGAVFVPRMVLYRYHEVRDAVDRTEAKAIIVADEFRGFDHGQMAMDLVAECPSLGAAVVVGKAPTGSIPFADLEKSGHYAGPQPDADDVHIILFTSGTTAAPKGVMHTFNSYVTCAKGLLEGLRISADDVCFMPSPIMHNTGLNTGVLLPVVAQGSSILQDVWEAGEALDRISSRGCTYTLGATPFVTMMVDALDEERHDLSKFRVFGCGGAPVPASVVRDAVSVLGCTLTTIFGQSESSLQTMTSLDDSVDRVSSSDGQAVPGTEVAILDDEGSELPRGEEGEICSRGPGVMLGYWQEAQQTADAFTEDGFFRSGDLGRMDGDGYIRVTGRKKDVIIRGGMNLSATEIEELVLEHPAVAQVAVVGMPDRRLGERICAFVVVAGEQAVELDELTTFLRAKRIANQKLPERLEIREELPMTPTGKVEKFKLRDEITALLDSE